MDIEAILIIILTVGAVLKMYQIYCEEDKEQ